MAGIRPADVLILIPAFNPNEKLAELVPKLKSRFGRIVLVDDGSSEGKEIFAALRPQVEAVLVHKVNRGKGAALKTGFRYVLECGRPAAVITVDADGQHRPEDVAKVAERLAQGECALVLGVRAFTGRVPFRSRFGNFWTRWFFFLMTGLWVRDTQTGLRGIPYALLEPLARIPGERYEYEMAVLASARHHPGKPVQVPIETVYEANNVSSHFNQLLDTIRIYRSLLQFCLSSVLGFVIDNALFAVMMSLTSHGDWPRRTCVLVSLAVARFVSANANYLYNRFVVFRAGGGSRGSSFARYWALVLVIAGASYALTAGAAALLDVRGALVTVVKIVVDTALFIASYYLQKHVVFRSA